MTRLYGDDPPVEHFAEFYRRVYEQLEAVWPRCLELGVDVVLDFGCWTRRDRPVTFDATIKHDLKSITKSVTSLLVGIGVDRGWIADINTPIFTYFPDHIDVRSPEKDRITLGHLLTMSAGLAWNESFAVERPSR